MNNEERKYLQSTGMLLKTLNQESLNNPMYHQLQHQQQQPNLHHHHHHHHGHQSYKVAAPMQHNYKMTQQQQQHQPQPQFHSSNSSGSLYTNSLPLSQLAPQQQQFNNQMNGIFTNAATAQQQTQLPIGLAAAQLISQLASTSSQNDFLANQLQQPGVVPLPGKIIAFYREVFLLYFKFIYFNHTYNN
jgi:hypothetical protein